MQNGKIRFIYPARTRCLSVTGRACALQCAHCGGYYLRRMTPLEDYSASPGDKQPLSFLISGGCNERGTVPLQNCREDIARLKGKGRLNFHVGLVDDEDIDWISRYADVVSFDFVADDDTIREVFGLDKMAGDYADTYRKLRGRCRVIPHICVGLLAGRIKGEFRALKELERLGVEGLVFIVFTPTPGTRYAGASPPPLREVRELFFLARAIFPEAPIYLGCMRPGGRYRERLDLLAVEAGFDGVVNPVPRAVDHARRRGLVVHEEHECCVLVTPNGAGGEGR